VGKSSLLNALVGRKTLARVSTTPGKTQLMNVFQIAGLYLVDLPGYGWAKASQAERANFRRLVEEYLGRRSTLRGVVWLLDIRHQPSSDDLAIRDLLVRTGRRTLTVLTKADKLGRAERLRAVRSRAEDLGVAPSDLLVTSARTGEGIGDLGDSILAAALPLAAPGT
jgi:GTP-binding protein